MKKTSLMGRVNLSRALSCVAEVNNDIKKTKSNVESKYQNPSRGQEMLIFNTRLIIISHDEL